ncbi:hypothetical protein F3J44_00405 [Pantoea sp. Tr-811]|nr:hypothetical protein [Pantoea sp. Tr-811]
MTELARAGSPWHRQRLSYDLTCISVGAGLPREAGDAVRGTGFAGVRGASPLLQGIAYSTCGFATLIGAPWANASTLSNASPKYSS